MDHVGLGVRIFQPKKWTGEERGAESDTQQVFALSERFTAPIAR
jgi:hypothetical protein